MNDLFGLIGTTIADKFRVDRVIGEGGFGVVYGGLHTMLGVPVAIKCLKPVGFTREERERAAASFLREGRILFGLGHPAIVRLYDVGVTADQQVPYAVLELLNGVTLASEIERRKSERRPFGFDELVSTLVPVLEAVSFAHERNVVHRDLKPANVMLVADQTRLTPKVLDFGTARGDAVATGRGPVGDPTATRGSFTPLYGAPEQWDASFGSTGPHTDVFALGMMIAEMALLAYPFAGDASSIMGLFRAATDESTRISIANVRPDLPPELDVVIRRALRVSPADRFPDARELCAAFRGAMKATPTTAPLARPLAPSATPPPSPPMVMQSTIPPSPRIGANTVEPHVSQVPPQGPSALPWVVGSVGILVAIGALGVGAAIVFSDRAGTRTNAGGPSAPAASTKADDDAPTSRSVAAAKPTAPNPPAPAKPTGPTRKVLAIASHVQGQAPFWTAGDIMTVAHAREGEMTSCAQKAVDLDPTLQSDISMIVHPTKDGTVESIQCSVGRPPHDSVGEITLCGCAERVTGSWKFPAAHGKLGMLDSAPFILDYTIAPAKP